MNDINADNLILQMRALAARSSAAPTVSDTAEKAPFADVMKQSIDDVNAAQQKAASMAASYEQGADVDIAEVMISLQKADLSFKAMTEVRNRLVSAYQDIMNMPI